MSARDAGPPTDDVVESLFARRMLLAYDEIDDDLANRLMAQLLLLEREDPATDITLVINSPGGRVTAALGVYDTMCHIEPDVETWVAGYAAGTALMLLAGGARGKRFALLDATLHLAWPESPSDTPAQRAANIASALREVGGRIAHDTNQSIRQITLDADRSRSFSAREALAYGLIDKIANELPDSLRGASPQR